MLNRLTGKHLFKWEYDFSFQGMMKSVGQNGFKSCLWFITVVGLWGNHPTLITSVSLSSKRDNNASVIAGRVEGRSICEVSPVQGEMRKSEHLRILSCYHHKCVLRGSNSCLSKHLSKSLIIDFCVCFPRSLYFPWGPFLPLYVQCEGWFWKHVTTAMAQQVSANQS